MFASLIAILPRSLRDDVLLRSRDFRRFWLSSVLNGFGGSAEQVFLTAVIGRERIVEAQTHFAATDSAARLLGPGIAGLLVQLLGAPFALLATAGASVAAILRLSPLPRLRE